MKMKAPLRYALAAALLAAPIGWLLAGIARAVSLEYHSALLHRPLYAPGGYLLESGLAALIAGTAIWLIASARDRG